jgi:hypothetical protein
MRWAWQGGTPFALTVYGLGGAKTDLKEGIDGMLKKILMCIPEGGGAPARFEAKVTGIAGNRIARICRDAGTLERQLRKPWEIYDLAILFAGTEAGLDNFVSLQELLEDIPVLLVLPESRPDICKRGHLLRPRFVSFAGDDFSDFEAVLRKMIRNSEAEMKQATE